MRVSSHACGSSPLVFERFAFAPLAFGGMFEHTYSSCCR
jgi:hypothetical protein